MACGSEEYRILLSLLDIYLRGFCIIKKISDLILERQ